LLFFLQPLIDIVRYSMSTVEITFGNVNLTHTGFDNFRHLFTVDPFFNQLIITLAYPSLITVAIIIVFSLLAAILVNGKFPGRSVVRTIFFIPIIMGANIAAATLIGEDAATQEIMESIGPEGFGGYVSHFFFQTLSDAGLPVALMRIVNDAVAGIFSVLSNSGVPVLIFLAGLQSIPPSLYEVARIEGATPYEAFWKVTLPMISPMILLSTVYTIIEQFTRHRATIDGIAVTFFPRVQTITADQGYGLGSAMVIIYVAACLLVVGIVTFLMSKVVFYYE
jgi:ABC-type sugar transport system permease subunit